MNSPVPQLETARLKLRAHKPGDYAAFAAMWADPIVTRHFGGMVCGGEESWGRLLRHAGHWAWMGFGYWAVEEKSTGKFVGEVGFADYKRGIASLENTPEIGWVFTSESHGQGYATEAARSVIAWGDARFGNARTGCIIRPENLASIRVAQKCGYHEFETTEYKGEPILVFVR